jgi:hypothetical protein
MTIDIRFNSNLVSHDLMKIHQYDFNIDNIDILSKQETFITFLMI